MADKTAQTIYIEADPATVMKVIADIGAYPDWVSEYKEAEVLEADAEGYLVAKSDFTVPVGPSYFERDSRNDYKDGDQ